MTFERDDSVNSVVNIKVIGVGGGGNNAVNRMIASNVKGADFIAINTDRQALSRSLAPTQLVIGEKITKGFGAGANPSIGARAAEESIDDIKAMLAGADMVFITAGMGGGTGTGAAPVVARVEQELDILTIGIVTKPFAFEGKRRMEQAEEGIAEFGQYVDSLVVIPNERLKMVSDTRITLFNAFSEADDVLRRGVQSISELINTTGFINLDFADVTAVMNHSGLAHMGIGSASGKDKAEAAAKMALASPLLETSIKGATGVILSISASPDVGLEDVDLACTMFANECNADANIIWGASFDAELEDEMRITVIATGFTKESAAKESAAPAKQEAPAAAPAAEAKADVKEEKAPEAPKTVEKKNTDDLDLDDFFGTMFGK